MGLQSFERALENMVEVVFSRSNRSSIRPVELGRRLLREMDDHRNVDVSGRRIVPNSFTFHLSARDHAGFADIEQALNHELCEAAREYARDEGYHLVGPISVVLLVDNELKPGRFGVQSQLREAGQVAAIADHVPQYVAEPEPVDWAIAAAPAPAPIPAAAAPVPAAMPIAAEPPLVVPFEAAAVTIVAAGVAAAPPHAPDPPTQHTPARVQLPSGERVNITNGVVTIGRLPDCTITLNDPNISRRHAEVHPGEPIVVVDLGSTNGTKVNGLRISGRQVLADGDIISLGGTHLRFEAARTSA
jgi:Protein of unknown function (DUF3662)/FHA domain